MTVPALHIRRMRNRYRVSDSDDPVGLQRQLDRMVTDRLPCVLDRKMGGLYQRLGLSADCLVAVRRLNIRIWLADFSTVAEPELIDRVAESWGQALLNGLERIVSRTGFEPGHALLSDTLAIFPDSISARRHHIRQLVRNATVPWWSRAVLGDDAVPQALPRLLIEMARTDSKAAAADIVELVGDPGPAWLSSLDAGQRDVLGKTLIAAVAAAAGGEKQDGGVKAGDSAPLASLAVTQRDLLRRCADADSATVLYCAFQLLAELPVVAEYAELNTRLERLLALPHRLADKQSSKRTVENAAPEVMVIEDGGVTSLELPENRRDSLPMSADIKSERASGSASADADEADLTMTDTTWVPVGCGGLLFLIRFALRQCEQGTDVNQAMLALGTQVLDAVFGRLSPAARRAAWRRDAGLLQVFAGLHEPLEDFDEQCHPADALRWARAVREAIAARIDVDVDAAPRGSEYVFGGVDESLSALDRLLLRPGRLRVTDTEAHLILPADAVDIGLRWGGWDIDPGWVPQLGRIIRLEYRG